MPNPETLEDVLRQYFHQDIVRSILQQMAQPATDKVSSIETQEAPQANIKADMYLISSDGYNVAISPGPMLIGRSGQCQIKFDAATISRRHALIYRDADKQQVLLVDLNSKNGTFVNGQPVHLHQPRYLKSGDIIQLGSGTIEFMVE